MKKAISEKWFLINFSQIEKKQNENKLKEKNKEVYCLLIKLI